MTWRNDLSSFAGLVHRPGAIPSSLDTTVAAMFAERILNWRRMRRTATSESEFGQG